MIQYCLGRYNTNTLSWLGIENIKMDSHLLASTSRKWELYHTISRLLKNKINITLILFQHLSDFETSETEVKTILKMSPIFLHNNYK